MKILLPIFLALVCGQSLACYVPPAEQIVTPQALLASAKTVVLARATKGEWMNNGAVRYYFAVERQFAGGPIATFDLVGATAPGGGGDETYSHHHDGRFWQAQFGRLPNDTDCEIHPDFVIGGTYLIFLNQPYTRKSFERIVRVGRDSQTKDKWLAYVEDYFSAPR
jgi:hypothetical protein